MGRFGRRVTGAPGGSSQLTGYGSDTFGDAGQGVWEDANRSIDTAAAAVAARMAREKRAAEEEERRQNEAAGKAAQQARDAKAAEEMAAANANLEATRRKMNEPGYQSPEGKVQPIAGAEAERAALAAKDPGFRMDVAAQKNKMVDDQILRDEKTRAAGLKDQEASQNKDERRQVKAINEVERFERAVDARDARVQRLQQLQATQATRALIDAERQEVSQLRRAIEVDDKVEQARMVYEDDARLYDKAKARVAQVARENGVKLSKTEAEEETRRQMDQMREESGWYTKLETGESRFDPDTSQARAQLEARMPIDVQSYHASVSPEEIERAKEIRYRMPVAMRDWKPGMWKANGIDEATAIRMASVGSMQAGRDALSASAPAASGRKEPVAAHTSSVGIGSSNSRPAPAPKPRRSAAPPAAGLAAPPTSTGGGPASAPRPGATPPLPAPAGRPSLRDVPARPSVAGGQFGMPEVQVVVPESMRKRDTKEQVLSGKVVGEKAAAGQRKLENVSSAITALEDVSPREAKELAVELAQKVPGVYTGKTSLKDGLEQLREIQRYETEAQMGALQEQIGEGASTEQAVAASLDPALAAQARGTMASDAERAAEMTPEKAADQQFGQAVQLLDRPRLELQTKVAQAVGADLQKDENSPTGYEDPATASGRGLTSILTGWGVDSKAAETAGQVFGEVVSEALDPLEILGAISGMGVVGKVAGGVERAMGVVGGVSAAMGVKDAVAQLKDLQASGGFLDKDGRLSASGASALTQLGISAGFGAASAKGIVGEGRGPSPLISPKAGPFTPEMLQARIAEETSGQRLVDSFEPGTGNLLPPGGIQISPEETARMTSEAAGSPATATAEAPATVESPSPAPSSPAPSQPVQAPTAEAVAAAQSDEDTVALVPDQELAKVQVGEKVSAPEGYDLLLGQETEWTKGDERTRVTTMQTPAGPVQLAVRLDEDGITMTAEQLQANYGKTELAADEQFQGLYTAGPREVNVSKRDLIQVLRGQGTNTKAHELIHFLKANGLISDADWAAISKRAESRVPGLAAAQGVNLEEASPAVVASLVEEAAANAFGKFASNRFLLRSAPAGLSYFSRVWETLHSMGSQLVGGDKAAFDRLLKQRYQKPAAPAPVQNAAASTPRGQAATTATATPTATVAETAVAQAEKKTGRKRKPKAQGPKASIAKIDRSKVKDSSTMAKDVVRAQYEEFKQFDTPKRRASAASFMVREKSDQEKLGLKPRTDDRGKPLHTWTRVEQGDFDQTHYVQYREDPDTSEPQVVGVSTPYTKGQQKGTVGMTLGGKFTGGDNRAMLGLMRATGLRHSELRSEHADAQPAKSGLEVGPNMAWEVPVPGTSIPTQGPRAAIGKKAESKRTDTKRLDIVALREKPKALKGTGANGKVLVEQDLYPWLEEQQADLSDPKLGLDEKGQLKVMVRQAIKEIQHQLKQRRSGAGWYRADIRELEHAAKKAHPELADPEQMGLFKALLAATSFGNKPAPNAEQAFQIYEHFKKTGDLPAMQKGGEKHWSGGPAFGYAADASIAKGSEIGSTVGKLNLLRKNLGSWGAVADFLAGEHTVRDLKAMGFANVVGKLGDVVPGGTVLGPKGGPFMQNITGKLGDLTGDLWFARTFNRLRGTKIVEAPRGPSERAMMRAFIAKVAKQMGVAPADAQAMLWFSEKDLYGKLTGNPDFGTYAVSGRLANESMQNKRELDETGTAPAATSDTAQQVSFETAWSTNSALNKDYPWSDLTPKQREEFTTEHGKWVLEEIHIETGAELSPVVEGTGPASWGGQPNLSVTIKGTPGQVRSAANLLGLAFEQDAIAVSTEVDGQTPLSKPTAVVSSGETGRPWGTREFLADVREAFDKANPEMAKHVALEVNVSKSGQVFVKAYPMSDADAEWMRSTESTKQNKKGEDVITTHFDRVLAATRAAVTSADPKAAIRGRKAEFEVEFPGNDWSTQSDGEGYRGELDEIGHSPEGLDEFRARVAANRSEAWAKTTAGPKASVGKKREVGSLAATWRAASGPIIKRLRGIKSYGGRPIGDFLAQQLENRRQAYETTAGRMVDRYNVAVRSLAKGAGDWGKVQAELDGKQASGVGLNAVEQAAVAEIRSVFKEIKSMAVHEGVFSGQGIRDYFPHMREDGAFSEDEMVQRHLDYLVSERPDLLEQIAKENEAWTGLIGAADNLELAAIDLAKNFNRESFWKGNPHLEKFRGPDGRPYRKDPGVGPKYILDAVRRIMDARYLGSKSEVITQGIRSIRDRADQDYVKKAMSEILGGARNRHFGTRLMAEVNTMNGLSKLGSAGLAQLTQLGVAFSEAAGASGTRRAFVDVARGLAAAIRARDLLYREAARSGGTFAADSGEAMKNFAGTGNDTYAQRLHRGAWSLLGLGRVVDSTYGVKNLDKFARVMADRLGRETYLRALASKDVTLLTELLGSRTAAERAVADDAPRVKQLEATFRAGGTDPLLSDAATRIAGTRLALAGKRFADKTQYRTDTQDQPLLFTHPLLKAANTFYSFAYSHWRWNIEHVQAGSKAMESGDKTTALRHARALAIQHMITAPILGAGVLALRSLLTGKGLEEKDEDDIKTFGEAWSAAMNLDTIGSDKFWTAHTLVAKYLQGWQYGGGIGYPMSYLERTSRAMDERDMGRGIASLVGGSPGEMTYDIGALGILSGRYAMTPTKANQKAATRAMYGVLFTHLLPNVLGLSGSARRKLTATEDRPQKSLGWLGMFDPDARWTKEHGWTSDAAEDAREEALEKRREREEEEERKVEAGE